MMAKTGRSRTLRESVSSRRRILPRDVTMDLDDQQPADYGAKQGRHLCGGFVSIENAKHTHTGQDDYR